VHFLSVFQRLSLTPFVLHFCNTTALSPWQAALAKIHASPSQDAQETPHEKEGRTGLLQTRPDQSPPRSPRGTCPRSCSHGPSDAQWTRHTYHRRVSHVAPPKRSKCGQLHCHPQHQSLPLAKHYWWTASHQHDERFTDWWYHERHEQYGQHEQRLHGQQQHEQHGFHEQRWQQHERCHDEHE